LGYEDQKIKAFSVDELTNDSANTLHFDPLHVTIIKVSGESKYLPSFPGIADQHFITDNETGRGLITKREVRLAILSLLQPAPNDIAWDIGAGCGGVAVEWALWNQLGTVHAIEHHPQRFDCLAQNQQRFGVVDNLTLVQGRAPEVLSELPAANKIFIGGSDGELPVLLASLWETLPIGGVIVASAVMETSRCQLIQFAGQIEDSKDKPQTDTQSGEVETLQIAVSRGGQLAGQLLYRPSLTVTLFKFTKTHKN
jgi:precorrin-6Y C5,15-methyltransferase (decarboxylating)